MCAAALIYLITPRHLPEPPPRAQAEGTAAAAPSRNAQFAFPVLLSIGVIDSATRMAFLTFLPFVLTAKGASLPTVGLALTLVFAGGAAGKLVCAFIGARIGTVATVWLTEGLTAALIVARLQPYSSPSGTISTPGTARKAADASSAVNPAPATSQA